MKQRLYVDINSGLGRTSFREDRIPYTVESLLEEMKYYRVHASVVFSNTARDYSFVKGNRELLELRRGKGRLYGVATVIPGIRFELEEGFGYFDGLVEGGVKAFKVYPRKLQHEFTVRSMGELAGYMAVKGLPLMVDADEIEWRDLGDVLEAFPDLKVVLCNSYWNQNRQVFPLMERFRNLYVDISCNQAMDILDRFKSHFGIERVLFGTNYPNKVMGGLKALVEYSGLSEEDKDKVAWKNAAGLFGIETPKPYNDAECLLDEIALKVDCGEPLKDLLVIDSHTHIVEEADLTVNGSAMVNGDADNLVRKMDRLGIAKICISSWEGLMTDGISANETDLKAWQKYRDRVEVYAMCNPNYEEDLAAVVDAYHEKYRFKGLKPYYSANLYDLLGDRYDSWFEYGNRNRLIMLVHAESDTIAPKVDILSDKYPDMIFIMAHSGAFYSTARANGALARKKENVYAEITYTTLTNGVIEYLVEEAGADKVLFGTDMPMRDPAPQLAWVCYARVSMEDKKKILGGNMKRLLEHCYTK